MNASQILHRLCLGAPVLLALITALGCATNPVTGESELSLVSETEELKIGAEQYAPSRQSQGGDYSADPELVGYVQQVGARLAAVADRELPYEFAVLNSSEPNAWALPGGKIAINRGLLLELNNEAELAAVLSHEIVHAAAAHGAQSLTRGQMLQVGVVGAAIASSSSDNKQLVMLGSALGANLINQSYNRGAESEADRYGMEYMHRAGYDPAAAVSLQETFVRLNQSKGSGAFGRLFTSHPPSPQRVTDNRRTLEKMAVGGELHADRYQTAIAHLHQVRDAYDAYDRGREALEAGDQNKAIQYAQAAIAIEPNEALFQGLLGDAHADSGDDAEALTAYNEAISLDDQFFHHFLQRADLYQRLGNTDLAKRDLQSSMQLLPTENAAERLRNLDALADG
ncbi:M48 family metalloprotease [Gammaproteobacteria bacterium]|nr:M48 family metalloprotease [Gammaproteobacteria bacterium]